MKCKYCGNQTRWLYTDNGGWYMAESDGSWHACSAGKVLDPEIVTSIQASVTVTDKWIADKFIKRLALFRWLYPRARMHHEAFSNGTLSDKQYLIRCSDKAFKDIMRTGNVGILQNRPGQ